MRRSGARSLLLILLAALTAPLGAQTATLVKDINADGPVTGSQFRQLTAAGGQLFFVTGDKALWVSGGTPETTRRVRDFCPGDCTGFVTIVGSFRGLALVSVHAPNRTSRLWRSDGTQAGTFPLSLSLSLERPVLFAGSLYLTGCTDSRSRCELWKSDGSQAGTVRLDLPPGEPYLTLDQVSTAGGRLFFTAFDSPDGFHRQASLWSSDGTAAKTQRLATLGHGNPGLLTAAGSRLFFALSNGHRTDLWTSDGRAAGTRSLRAFFPASPTFSGERLHVLGGKVFFVAHDAADGKELWTSDGTPDGTRRVTHFSLPGIEPRRVRVAGGRIVFLAADRRRGLQIWSTAGTPESVTAVPNPPCSGCSFVADGTLLTLWGNRIFFYGVDNAHGAEPWVTDGTAAGTRLVADLCPGTCNSVDPGDADAAPVVTPQGLFFVAADPVHGKELWRTDGTAAGTVRQTEIEDPEVFLFGQAAALGPQVFFGLGEQTAGPSLWVSELPGEARRAVVVAPHGPSSDPYELTSWDGHLVFTAASGEGFGVARLWKSDGSAESTVSFGPSLRQSISTHPTAAGGFLFFLRQAEDEEKTLWRTDGTEAGTIPLKPFVDGGLAAYQGKLWFSFRSPSAPPHEALWSSDGTAAGTVPVFSLPPEVPEIARLTGLGSDLFFLTGRFFGPGEIWHSDGTLAGTRKIAALAHIPAEDFDPRFTRLGERVLFLAGTVWATDGTPAGAAPLFPAGRLGQLAADLVVFQGAAYFLATGPLETAIWRTDGTPGGTVLVREIEADLDSFPPRHQLMAGAGRLWLIAADRLHGEELWTSDGTAAGTALLADLNPGADGSLLSALTTAGGRLYFAATDGAHGIELWQSDGTAAGTRMVQDIAPFATSSAPAGLTVAGDRLYFSADDGPAGRELWSLALSGGSRGGGASSHW